MWTSIPFAPEYEINEIGTVRRCLVSSRPRSTSYIGTILSPYTLRSGYVRVQLSIDGIKQKWYIHRLVAYAFLGQPPFKEAQVAHLDGNKSNNHYSNLMWATAKENASHKVTHGTIVKGEAVHSSKITEEDVRIIRKSSALLKAISTQYNIAESTISRIKNNKTWQHVS